MQPDCPTYPTIMYIYDSWQKSKGIRTLRPLCLHNLSSVFSERHVVKDYFTTTVLNLNTKFVVSHNSGSLALLHLGHWASVDARRWQLQHLDSPIQVTQWRHHHRHQHLCCYSRHHILLWHQCHRRCSRHPSHARRLQFRRRSSSSSRTSSREVFQSRHHRRRCRVSPDSRSSDDWRRPWPARRCCPADLAPRCRPRLRRRFIRPTCRHSALRVRPRLLLLPLRRRSGRNTGRRPRNRRRQRWSIRLPLHLLSGD